MTQEGSCQKWPRGCALRAYTLPYPSPPRACLAGGSRGAKRPENSLWPDSSHTAFHPNTWEQLGKPRTRGLCCPGDHGTCTVPGSSTLEFTRGFKPHLLPFLCSRLPSPPLQGSLRELMCHLSPPVPSLTLPVDTSLGRGFSLDRTPRHLLGPGLDDLRACCVRGQWWPSTSLPLEEASRRCGLPGVRDCSLPDCLATGKAPQKHAAGTGTY